MNPDARTTIATRTPAGLFDWLTSSRVVPWLTFAMTLAVLALVVALGALHLRKHLREHLVNRDGEILYAVALARQYANGAGSNLTRHINVPADQLALALDISQLREGTLAVRLFDRDGRFVTAVPPTATPATLPPGEMVSLRQLQPVSRFLERARLSDQFLMEEPGSVPDDTLPLLEVNIPIHARDQTRLLGAAQLVVDGRPLLRQYSRVDEHLWWLALGIYAVGAALLSGVLVWAYRRLHRAHLQLADRTTRLLRANHELTLAAKTTALGSVTAHLIHGLSNPLANLQNLVSSHTGNGKSGSDMETVAAATRRMQQLVEEVVRVLGEERGGENYELTLAELAGVLRGKLEPAADTAGVQLVTRLDTEATLSNRTANLALLILENLVHNALKMTPPGRCVRVRFASAGDGGVACRVEDEGPGLPAELIPRLFTPCRSTHGGSGLGLAISKQLANQLGARLELNASSPAGCVFTLTLSRSLFEAEQNPDTGRSTGRPNTSCETANPDTDGGRSR